MKMSVYNSGMLIFKNRMAAAKQKITFTIISFTFVFLIICKCAVLQNNKENNVFNNPYKYVEYFKLSSDKCILEDRHIWISSEVQTFNPDFSGIGGITKIFSHTYLAEKESALKVTELPSCW